MAPPTTRVGQSFAVFTRAHLLGFELVPRLRAWKDLAFYRPGRATRDLHIDGLFGEPGKNVIDRTLIAAHFRELLRVAASGRTPSPPRCCGAACKRQIARAPAMEEG